MEADIAAIEETVSWLAELIQAVSFLIIAYIGLRLYQAVFGRRVQNAV